MQRKTYVAKNLQVLSSMQIFRLKHSSGKGEVRHLSFSVQVFTEPKHIVRRLRMRLQETAKVWVSQFEQVKQEIVAVRVGCLN